MEIQHPRFQQLTINPGICAGEPCIRGMRALIDYLASDRSVEEIVQEFPFLEKYDIPEAFAFSVRVRS
jgi:uncharacterized protein (DUF433 family)